MVRKLQPWYENLSKRQVKAPKLTPSMIGALSDLKLDHLWVMYPGDHAYKAHEDVTVYPVKDIAELPRQF